jgi:hypothetical protein
MTSINLTNSSGICGNAAPRPPGDDAILKAAIRCGSVVSDEFTGALGRSCAENVRQQGQREREKEAMFRGEQVADAIRSYYRFRGAQG